MLRASIAALLRVEGGLRASWTTVWLHGYGRSMSDRRRRLSRLLSHWPELSERERLWLLIALGLNGVVGMGIEVVALVSLIRAGRRSWRAQDRDSEAAERLVGLRVAAGWLAASQGQKLLARAAFTSYEQHLSRRRPREA